MRAQGTHCVSNTLLIEAQQNWSSLRSLWNLKTFSAAPISLALTQSTTSMCSPGRIGDAMRVPRKPVAQCNRLVGVRQILTSCETEKALVEDSVLRQIRRIISSLSGEFYSVNKTAKRR